MLSQFIPFFSTGVSLHEFSMSWLFSLSLSFSLSLCLICFAKDANAAKRHRMSLNVRQAASTMRCLSLSLSRSFWTWHLSRDVWMLFSLPLHPLPLSTVHLTPWVGPVSDCIWKIRQSRLQHRLLSKDCRRRMRWEERKRERESMLGRRICIRSVGLSASASFSAWMWMCVCVWELILTIAIKVRVRTLSARSKVNTRHAIYSMGCSISHSCFNCGAKTQMRTHKWEHTTGLVNAYTRELVTKAPFHFSLSRSSSVNHSFKWRKKQAIPFLLPHPMIHLIWVSSEQSELQLQSNSWDMRKPDTHDLLHASSGSNCNCTVWSFIRA